MLKVRARCAETRFRETTDTLEGEYVAIATQHRGFNFAGGLQLTTWWEGEVWFRRASDGVHEPAARGQAQATERKSASWAKMEAGRHTTALKRGVRLEHRRDQERGARLWAKHEERARAQQMRKAAPDLYAALKLAVETHGPLGDDTRPVWWPAACNAVSKAEAWEESSNASR